MSFWNLGNDAPTTGSFETGGGNIEPIPSNTTVLAMADEAKWDSFNGEEYISIRWAIMQPEEYKNRKVFHKIKVGNPDENKAQKAKRMLAAVDANAGGNLMASGEAPTDESLTKHLTHKPMMLKLQVWELETETGEKKTGNWVSAVSPRNGNSAPSAPPKQTEKKEDDIPF